MTVEQYLRTSFEVEPDYLDGELVERYVGSLPHARAKGRMLELLCDLKGFSWHAYPSVTLIMSPTRCRVADLAVFAEEPSPGKRYPDEPGELAIEVVEQEDRFAEMMQRLTEYKVWGFKNVWLVDPWTHKLFIYGHLLPPCCHP
jgi:Uma2 family endonuclease